MTFGGHFRSCNEVHPVEIEMCLFRHTYVCECVCVCVCVCKYTKRINVAEIANEKWAKNVSKSCCCSFAVVVAAAVFVDCIKLYEVPL